jgi:hypothetical protein
MEKALIRKLKKKMPIKFFRFATKCPAARNVTGHFIYQSDQRGTRYEL